MRHNGGLIEACKRCH